VALVKSLQIYNARERALVRLADVAIAPLRAWPDRRRSERIQRILILRLERIGDLLMTLAAIQDARRAWPDAEIDLAVGRWNEPIARLIPAVTSVVVADAPWLARGDRAASWPPLIRTARGWRQRRYDLVINIEPDIRSNFLAWLTGAPIRVGYGSAGGAAFLTDALEYDSGAHVSQNARRIVARAAGQNLTQEESGQPPPRLVVPDAARARARKLVGEAGGPFVGIHASGGRLSKQWHLDRFAMVGRTLARDHGATIVLTGSADDKALVDEVALGLGTARIVRVDGQIDLLTLAALLESLDLLISSDTGPMHLAAAVGTPVVALFGPSNPIRYGPQTNDARVLRVELPCSPCGQVRLPPLRCRGHVPDCMDGITAAAVILQAGEILDRRPSTREPVR